MRVKPVTRYRPPAFPNLGKFQTDPEALIKYAPLRWLKRPFTLAALAAFCSGCSKMDAGLVGGSSEDTQQAEVGNRSLKSTNDKVVVAPLFIHGDGSGSTGCVAISAPAFLSEYEAVTLIIDQLKQAGIDLDQFNVEIGSIQTMEWKRTVTPKKVQVEVPGDAPGTTKRAPLDVTEGIRNDKVNKTKSLSLQAYSRQLNLGILFVGSSNYFGLGGEPSGWSIQSYDLIPIAQAIKEKIQGYQKVNAAVFYDPAVYCGRGLDSGMDKDCDQARREARDMLIQQVRDFAKWFASTRRTAG